MNDKNNKDFNIDEQPVLSPEEIQLIKELRQRSQRIREEQNAEAQNPDNNNVSSEKKPFKVNIPAQELYTPQKNNYYINRNNYNNVNYNRQPHPNDVPIYNNYNNVPQERYDHNRYLAQKAQQEQQQNQKPQKKPKKHKKKKGGKGCGTILLCFLMILIILIAGCYGYIYSLAQKVQIENLDENVTENLIRNDDIKNILLIGLDKESGGISRSDTMMLLSIDTENKEIKLTSFLRDLWVNIPGYYNSKLNASYAFGGSQLTIDTIESNFGIDIDHFVLVDFEMFEKIIDSLGGVSVEITEREADFLTRNTRVKIDSGIKTLDGESALIYSRIRKLDSDFYRTGRQRKVISAIINKAKKSNPITLAAMLSEIMPLFTTDIQPFELTQLAFSSLKYINYDINQLQVPADDAYTSQTISGQSALVPDMDKNIDNIIDFIYG